MIETIGKRLARLRQERGWTQQALADRLAISRVAVSHFEMDLSLPSERTVTLLAGVFKLSPWELVQGTSYPQAKADRLPAITCCHTSLELDLALMKNNLGWLQRLEDLIGKAAQPIWADVWEHWWEQLQTWDDSILDQREKEMLAAARKTLAAARK